jgi:hypothetical protein
VLRGAKNKKKSSWLKILLFVGVVAATIGILAACSPSTPEPMPEIKTYHVEITYIRPEILYPQAMEGIFCGIAIASWSSSLPYREQSLGSDYFNKLDDYTFIMNTPYLLTSNENGNPHKISFYDGKRWDGVHDGSMVVATRIIFKVVETGFSLEVQNIGRCDLKTMPSNDEFSRMGKLWLTTDGKLK